MVRLIDREIQHVAIVDDDPGARGAYRWAIEEAHFVPVEEGGPMTSVSDSLVKIHSSAEAVLCDLRLRKRNYATSDGAEFVAACNTVGLPAILCTQYERPDVAQIRRFRRYVPVLLQHDDLEPDRLVEALEVCINEIEQGPAQHRRLWRTQVRVVDEGDPDQAVFYVVVPAWGSSERVGVRRSDVPDEIAATVADGRRYHVEVNLGAESADDLFFGTWEVE